jgi:uncharacterized coiled-coil DUF342 family protein
MDVQTILLSVEERDKWRRRLDLLKGSLKEVQTRRQQLERKLKALKRELAHLAEVSQAMIDPGRLRPINPVHGAEQGPIPRR